VFLGGCSGGASEEENGEDQAEIRRSGHDRSDHGHGHQKHPKHHHHHRERDGGTCTNVPDAGADSSDANDEDAIETKDGAIEADGSCSSRSVDEVKGLFVSPNGGDVSGCGGPDTPCRTVQAGIDHAQALGRTVVYVAAGVYVESIRLVAGVAVEGGWLEQQRVWIPDCSPSTSGGVVIEAPADQSITVLADGLGGSSSLRALTIRSKDTTNVTPSESLYGVFARGVDTTLTLEDVSVRMVAAGDGLDGDPGRTVAAATGGGCANNPGGGQPGSAGTARVALFSASGFTPGTGSFGRRGGIGETGIGGGAGQCAYCWGSSCVPFCPPTGTLMCSSAGQGGCGGAGGPGGAPGSGGGSSLALFVWDANVTVRRGTLEAGRGGTGGTGGPGATGGPGGNGVEGAAFNCASCYVISATPTGRLCGTISITPLAGGSPGTAGEIGGTGGEGGPGAGGWSCAYYQGGNASVTMEASSLEFDAAGPPGAPNGFAGKAMAACTGNTAGGMPTGSVAEFPIPTSGSSPLGITVGDDGNVWFTESATNKIGRITPAGTITEFASGMGQGVKGITAGPDGALWFVLYQSGQVARMTDTGTLVQGFRIPANGGYPLAITSGPDGNVWFTETYAAKIGVITPAGVLTEFLLPNSQGASVQIPTITSGPDGNLWFTVPSRPEIGRITVAGRFASIPGPLGVYGIAPGPDGAIWFTDDANTIGKVTMIGEITEFPIPTSNSGPRGIVAGPDGSLWFTENRANRIGRITTAGVVSEFPIPTADSGPSEITAGPDGNLWFIETTANRIAYIRP
jgi:streptogramin lyase